MKKLLLFLLVTSSAWGQFTNAKSIWGRPICNTTPADANLMTWSAASNCWKPLGSGAGTGTVTSVGLAGTANQLTVTGSTPITTSGSWTVSIPSDFRLPGTINKLTLTQPATGSTFTLIDGKTFTVNNTLTITATDGITMTTPTTSFTAARTDAANTFTGHQTIEGTATAGATGSGNLVFGTSPTIVTPTIASFTNATHAHTNAAGGGTLAEAALALTDITTNNATTSLHGFLPKLGGGTANFLRADGTWAAPSGSGTVTVVSSGTLTSTGCVTGGGTQTVQTPSSSCTIDASGNIVANSISTAGGSTAGYLQLGQGTAPSNGTTAVQLVAPAAVTSYQVILPAAAASGIPRWANSSNTVTESISELSGNVVTSGSNVATVKGIQVGTSLPGTCTVGDLYFKSDATAGQNIYECQATNTWTQQLNSGGGGGGAFPQTVSGTTTSGGIPCFTATTTLSSSGLLVANKVLFGGGAGVCPNTTPSLTFDGSNKLTWGNNSGSSGILTLNGTSSTSSGVEYSYADTVHFASYYYQPSDFLYFRNHSLSDQNWMVVQGATNRVGIGQSAPTAITTLGIQDTTATTGATKVIIQAGQGQSSTKLLELQGYNATHGSGSVVASIDASGNLVVAGCTGCGAGSGTVDTSGSPANHQLARFSGSTTITGIAVGATDKPLVGVSASDPVFSKLTLTNPATAATLTIADNKTVTINNTLTLAGTDSTTMTFPTTSATLARTDAANTFTGHQTIEGVTSTGATGTNLLVFATSPTLTSPTITTDLRCASAGGCTIGTAALPGSSIYLGSAATNNIRLTGTSAAARVVVIPDVGTDTGATVVLAATSTTTTQVLHAGATAGLGVFSAIAAGDLPSTLTSGTAITNAALTTPAIGAATGASLVLSGALTSNALTSGRVTFAGTSGILQDDSDMTFATDTLTVTKVVASTSLTVAGAAITNNVVQNSQSTAYTTVLADAGKHIYHPSADTTARTWTIDSNANVAYPIGTTISFVNDCSAGTLTIAITSDTLILSGAGTTGSRTIAACGEATAIKMTSTRWMINGTGLT